ncbi:MAG: DNA repair protein RecO [Legionellales bacterium]|nr:DNA repair protein RecO [Legionellales bacterium]|tara:strand:- start:311 stop:1033 length:723 start_codon:yes stop_codon:yes gene_type:complete
MRVDYTPCYILHSRNYSESSLILEIFSRNYGRVNLIAKGAKKNKKYTSINFDPYQKYNISWINKIDLGILLEIESYSEMIKLASEKTMIGFYLNEIILKLLHKHEPYPELFDIYELTLKRLINNENEKTILRYFEKNLLQLLGYGITLDYDIQTGEPILSDRNYYYKIDSGPSSELSASGHGMKISGKTLLQLNDESLLGSMHITEAKNLLTMIIEKYIDKPLESKKLYKSYAQIKNQFK